jgi:hypothetical protein
MATLSADTDKSFLQIESRRLSEKTDNFDTDRPARIEHIMYYYRYSSKGIADSVPWKRRFLFDKKPPAELFRT